MKLQTEKERERERASHVSKLRSLARRLVPREEGVSLLCVSTAYVVVNCVSVSACSHQKEPYMAVEIC